MTSSNRFDQDYIDRELFTIDLDSDDDSVLKWMYTHWRDFINENGVKLEEWNDNLAYYLGYARGIDGNNRHRLVTDISFSQRRSHQFVRLKLPYLRDTIDNLTSRFTVRQPNFVAFPKDPSFVTTKRRTNAAQKFMKSKSDEEKFVIMQQDWIRNIFIFGDSFLEIYWDEHAGPDKFSKAQKDKKIPLKDSEGKDTKNEKGDIVYINQKLKLGDVKLKVWDPRFCVCSPDWIILFEYISCAKLRARYPDEAKEIQTTSDIDFFDPSEMKVRSPKDHTVLMKLYHKVTPELPEGRFILSTPDVVLKNGPLPHETLIDQNLFPVIQLTDYVPPGGYRGMPATAMIGGKTMQTAIHNVSNRIISTIANFYPHIILEEGSIDMDLLRSGLPTYLPYKRGYGAPSMIQAPTVPQDLLNFLEFLIKSLRELANVMPPSRGDPLPNTESRIMLDWYKDQETAQSMTIDDKVKQGLIESAAVMLAIAADMYTDNKDEIEKRTMHILGPRNIYSQEELDIAELKHPFDIKIETINSFADTFQGKIQQITQINQVAPGAMTPARVLDELGIGGAQELADTITASIELAKKELEMITQGKKPKSPQKYLDLLPYYEEYLKALQNVTINQILPDVFDPRINPDNLEGSEKVAQLLLLQVNAIEGLLIDAIDNQKSKGLADPNSGVAPLETAIFAKFPSFPSLYKDSAEQPIDPFALKQQQALQQQQNGAAQGGDVNHPLGPLGAANPHPTPPMQGALPPVPSPVPEAANPTIIHPPLVLPKK